MEYPILEMAGDDASPRFHQESKASPKLRLLANGSTAVNRVRAIRDGTLGLVGAAAAPAPDDVVRVPEEQRSRRPELSAAQLEEERGHLDRFAQGVATNVFVRLRSATAELSDELRSVLSRSHSDEYGEPERAPELARSEEVIAAQLTFAEIDRVLELPEVAGVEASERITFHQPLRGRPTQGRLEAELRRTAHQQRAGARDPWPRYARRPEPRAPKVLIGIVDIGGFDFCHPDFQRSTRNEETRFHRIWDQKGRFRDPPRGFSYGSEIRHEQMVRATVEAVSGRLRPYELEPQGLMMIESHATHVASIAGGLSGVCPHAELVGVSVHLPVEDEDRRRCFYDSTRLADAMQYLLRVRTERAAELGIAEGDLPIAINVSLGTNGHAHDGSSAISRWLDHVLAEPGRAITVAPGNAGQQGPVEPGDLGFMLGRIHTAGRIAAEGLTRDLHWVVPGDGEGDFSENELEIWYEPQDLFSVQLRTPGGDWLPAVEAGEFIENRMLASGTLVSIYSDRFAVSNGCNRIAIYLSPFLSATHPIGVQAGTWTVRLGGLEIRDGRYHGWIERDDPRPLGRAGRRELWALPSFFSATTNVGDSSVSSLACGQSVIAVGNLDPEQYRMNVTSSQGPTRDGRQKPEVAAPGTDIVAASGFDTDKRWVAMSGTSMAAPYVCGIAAQMLALRPSLTAPQIQGILRRCCQPLPGAGFEWQNDAGFGPLAVERLRSEVESLGRLVDKFPRGSAGSRA